MGTIPPPPETKREPLPARRLQAGEGTKRNQMEGIPPAALDETRLRASLPTSNPNPGGTRDSGSRPPLAQETSGNGGGVPNLFRRLESPPPFFTEGIKLSHFPGPRGARLALCPGPELGGAPEGKTSHPRLEGRRAAPRAGGRGSEPGLGPAAASRPTFGAGGRSGCSVVCDP